MIFLAFFCQLRQISAKAKTLENAVLTKVPAFSRVFALHKKIGVTGFEPATSRPPAVRSSQTEPYPATFRIIPVSVLCCKYKMQELPISYVRQFLHFFLKYLKDHCILSVHRLSHGPALSWPALYRAVHLPDRSC